MLALTTGAALEDATATSGRQILGEVNVQSDEGLLERYCVTCHNERLRTGDLSLEGVSFETVGEHPELWEKVLHKLDT